MITHSKHELQCRPECLCMLTPKKCALCYIISCKRNLAMSGAPNCHFFEVINCDKIFVSVAGQSVFLINSLCPRAALELPVQSPVAFASGNRTGNPHCSVGLVRPTLQCGASASHTLQCVGYDKVHKLLMNDNNLLKNNSTRSTQMIIVKQSHNWPMYPRY